MDNTKAIKEKIKIIEERQKQRQELAETFKEEALKKIGEFKSESSRLLNRQTRIISMILTILVLLSMIAFSIWEKALFINMSDKGYIWVVIKYIPFIPLTYFISFFSIKYIKVRDQRLCNALEEASRGNLGVRLDLKGAGAYKRAYSDFNQMCENLEHANSDLIEALEMATQANEAKSMFVSNMSHEVRTPLNAVLGLNEMIIRESREKNIRDYSIDIRSAGKTLLSLINDVLDASKIEAGKMTIVPVKYDLSATINDIVNMTKQRATDKGLDYEIRVDNMTPHKLLGDEGRIKQCVLNILSNAIKYTEKGSVHTEITFAKADAKNTLITFSVTDTGRGIREEDMEKLFTAFERIDENKNKNVEGTGLGMNITQNLLKLMGSKLTVESKYGFGSTFKFSVSQEVLDWEPIGDVEARFDEVREEQSQYTESFQAPDAKILVVDDSSVNLMIVDGLLKKTKMQLDMVESGAEAIKLSSEKEYDILLIDHMMPDMDGIETAHRIREDENSLNKKSVIIALTANAVSGAKDYYISEGFDDYLCKPIEPEKLESALAGYLPKSKVLTENLVHEEREPDLEEGEGTSFEEEDKTTEGEDEFITKMSKIPLLSTEKGLEYSGSLELYKKVVGEFADTGYSRADTIETYFEQSDYRNYTIQVHALKSAARIIGATALSQLAAALEEAGNEENQVKIENATGELLRLYRDLVASLEAITNCDDDLPEIDEASLKDAVMTIREMVEGFDFDSVDSVMAELKKYKIPESFKDTYNKLKTLVAEVARDEILTLLENM